MSSLMGTPVALVEQQVSAKLPSFGGSAIKSAALEVHVKLAKTTHEMLRSKYRHLIRGAQ